MQHTIDTIKEKLASDPRWVERAIVVLFERQTLEEQQSECTTDANGIGFNAFDAKTLSYYANWIRGGNRLSGKYLDNAFKMVPKYAKQILSIINSK